MIMNKRGQTSTIGVTIAIVLGIALIVFLIWGFSTNWTMFRSTSDIYTGTTSLDSMKSACIQQCENNREAEFCAKKTVVGSDGKAAQMNCKDLTGVSAVSCPTIPTCA